MNQPTLLTACVPSCPAEMRQKRASASCQEPPTALEVSLRGSVERVQAQRQVEEQLGTLVREQLSAAELGRLALAHLRDAVPQPRFPWNRSRKDRAAYFAR